MHLPEPPFTHHFGTVDEPLSPLLLDSWNQIRPRWRQVHGIDVAQVTTPAQECGDVDALFTRVPKTPIGIVTADCVPVLVRGTGVVGAAHAGWRGVIHQIVPTLLKQISSQSKEVESLQVWLGPAIQACCYEVSEELLEQFREKHPKIEPKSLTPYNDRRLSLHHVLEHQLQLLGVNQIERSLDCTFCAQKNGKPKYHSYRREKSTARQYSTIWLP